MINLTVYATTLVREKRFEPTTKKRPRNSVSSSKATMKTSMKKAPPSQVRIIGGAWRGQKLNFVPIEGLRPTGDRIKETLFNWLAPVINGAHCLDLFAGSGALGFEALSRGANSATLLEKAPEAITLLQQNKTRLKAKEAYVIGANALEWLKTIKPSQPFDIVFLDPPFAEDFLQPCCDLLDQRSLLSNNAYIYVESDVNKQPPTTPSSWHPLKEKITGQVTYRLYRID